MLTFLRCVVTHEPFKLPESHIVRILFGNQKLERMLTSFSLVKIKLLEFVAFSRRKGFINDSQHEIHHYVQHHAQVRYEVYRVPFAYRERWHHDVRKTVEHQTFQ